MPTVDSSTLRSMSSGRYVSAGGSPLDKFGEIWRPVATGCPSFNDSLHKIMLKMSMTMNTLALSLFAAFGIPSLRRHYLVH